MKFAWTIVAAALILPTTASTEIRISKPKPTPRATQAAPAPQPTARARARPRPAPAPSPRPTTPPQPTGIDPALVNETLVEAGYTTEFANSPSPAGPSISTTTGNSAWRIAFKDCGPTQRCGQMEFYTLWRVSNEANVCYAWMNAITQDPTGTDGKPTCYTLPNAGNQLHLTMSTSQIPYIGIAQLSGDRAKSKILGMLNVWSSHVVRLPEAYAYARTYCPRKSRKCDANPVAPDRPALRRRTDGLLPGT